MFLWKPNIFQFPQWFLCCPFWKRKSDYVFISIFPFLRIFVHWGRVRITNNIFCLFLLNFFFSSVIFFLTGELWGGHMTDGLEWITETCKYKFLSILRTEKVKIKSEKWKWKLNAKMKVSWKIWISSNDKWLQIKVGEIRYNGLCRNAVVKMILCVKRAHWWNGHKTGYVLIDFFGNWNLNLPFYAIEGRPYLFEDILGPP